MEVLKSHNIYTTIIAQVMASKHSLVQMNAF